MRKTKSFLNENRRYGDKYKTFFAILVILLLIPTTVSLGKTIENTASSMQPVSLGEDNFLIVINGGFGFSAVISNNGTSNATNVEVTLHVEGGLLRRINKTITDTVNIPARGVVIISTGMFLGLGRVTITASANVTEKIAQGVQILLFSKVMDDTWNRLAESNTGVLKR